jgi:divalent metal cation (Fe/Co/Zn/Cd) transporter
MESKALPLVTGPADSDRDRLVVRARLLAWLGIGWHAVEATIAIAAGIAASSVALVGFGADSIVESIAGFVLIWRFGANRHTSEVAEQRAYRLIAVTFWVIAAYVGVEAIRQLAGGSHPDTSWIGIGLAIVTLTVMPPLARAKTKVAEGLGSAATKAEGRQNMLCAYLSAGLLLGLGANALLGAWWADPLAALLIAGVAVREGREAWRGEACCDAC